MNITPLDADEKTHIGIWACPMCRSTLSLNKSTWQCANQHSFDKAKEGYVNLHLVQNKRSKAPGDSKEMVIARREFLESDNYLPLAHSMVSHIAKYSQSKKLDNVQATRLFDAGCGEGYYLRKIIENLEQSGINVSAQGIDLSKPAVMKAAKALKGAAFAVANCFDIPLADHSQDVVIQVFAPSSDKEVNRILKPKGLWIKVNPNSKHLLELKSLTYDAPKHHEVNSNAVDGFETLAHDQLSYQITLNELPLRQNLLKMTPFYWTISPEKKKLLNEQLHKVTADFDIQVLTKT